MASSLHAKLPCYLTGLPCWQAPLWDRESLPRKQGACHPLQGAHRTTLLTWRTHKTCPQASEEAAAFPSRKACSTSPETLVHVLCKCSKALQEEMRAGVCTIWHGRTLCAKSLCCSFRAPSIPQALCIDCVARPKATAGHSILRACVARGPPA